jgi:hypothetical protein
MQSPEGGDITILIKVILYEKYVIFIKVKTPLIGVLTSIWVGGPE